MTTNWFVHPWYWIASTMYVNWWRRLKPEVSSQLLILMGLG